MKITDILNGIKIKVVVLVSAVLWILVFSQVVISTMCEEKVSIKEAFAIGDEISVQKYSNEIVSKISGENMQNKSFEKVAETIMKINGCDNYSFEECNNEEETESCIVTGEIEDYIIEIVITKLIKTNETYVHSYISGQIFDECCMAGMRIKEVLGKMGAESIIYTRIDAQVSGKMTNNMCRQQTQKIYRRIDAEKVSEHYDSEYTSYGHSKKLGEAIVSDGKRINVQVRYNYNEMTDKTEIVIATPLIMD